MSLSLFEAEPRFNSASMLEPEDLHRVPDHLRWRSQPAAAHRIRGRLRSAPSTSSGPRSVMKQVVSGAKQRAGRRGSGRTRAGHGGGRSPSPGIRGEFSTFSGVRRCTMSTSWVVSGAPCATAASPPTSTNSTPLAASRESRVVSSAGGEAITQFLNGSQHSIVLTQALLRRERQHRVDERHIQCPGVDVVRGSSRLVHEDNCTRSIVRTHRSPPRQLIVRITFPIFRPLAT